MRFYPSTINPLAPGRHLIPSGPEASNMYQRGAAARENPPTESSLADILAP